MKVAEKSFRVSFRKYYSLDDKSGLYTEISPRGGEFGVWTKEGGARRAEAQWYHVRCYTLGGARMIRPAPPFISQEVG